MQRIILVFAYTLLYYVAAQDQGEDKFNQLLSSIFTQSVTSAHSSTTDPNLNILPNSSLPANLDCECVPYYLCDNGKIIDNGVGIIDIRVDTCNNSLELCCESSDKVTEPITPKPKTNKTLTCGERNAEGIGFRIMGDDDTESQFGEFPWMVALLREQPEKDNEESKFTYQCGASLIHPQVVLTGAHCVPNKTRQYKIRAGEWDTQTTYELYPHQDRDVKTILVHPQYYAGALFYDYALLILDSPVEITENVNVICLPKKNVLLDNLSCYATGWGKDVFAMEGKYKAILSKIELPIVNRDKCQEQLRSTRLGSRFKLHETFICAGGEMGKDTCRGDGGSPLACPIAGEENKYFQAGIVAWGIGCGERNIAGVYAHVAEAVDWIDQEMASNNFDTSYYQY